MKMLPLGFMPFFQLNCSARMCLFSSGCSEREKEMSEEDEEGSEKCLTQTSPVSSRQKIKEDRVKNVFFHKLSSIFLSDCPNGQLVVNH